MNSNTNSKRKMHAILVPLPLQGHVIPFVQLAIKLASKGFSITFINTHFIDCQITLSNATTTAGGDIFVEARESMGLDIEYTTVSEGLPLEYDRSLNHDQWVGSMTYCFRAHLEVAVAEIMRSRPSDSGSVLIIDSYFVWASKLAKKYELLHVSFWTEPAMVLDIYFHHHLLLENGHIGPGSSRRKEIIDYIPGISSLKRSDLTSYLQEEDLTALHPQYNISSLDDTKKAHFILGNTVQELEAQTISAIQAHVPFYAIGPLFSPGFTKGPVTTSLWAESDCTHWLDSKSSSSVLYISFGSYAHINKEELEEIVLTLR